MRSIDTFQRLRKLKRLLERLGLDQLPVFRQLTVYLTRRYFRAFYHGSEESVLACLHGLRIAIPRRYVEQFVFREYEPMTTRAFLRVLRRGMVAVDVGAHIGYYTLLFARSVGKSGSVHAVEPCQENRDLIVENLRLNRYDEVLLHACAAGRSRGTRTFHLTRASDSHGFYPHPLAETVETVEMPEAPLDELVQGPVHAVKIDVEGAEIEVLEGMRRILAENPSLFLCVEWNPSCMQAAGYDPIELPRWLERAGFGQIRVLDDLERRTGNLRDLFDPAAPGQLADFWYVNLWAQKVG